MRPQEDITSAIQRITPTITQGENLILETLLDIRELLIEQNKK